MVNTKLTAMNHEQRTTYRKSSGFTLIELLMVVAIIGLLVVLATFSYGNVQAKARDSRRKQEIADIKKALQLYYDDNQTYPATANATTIGSYLSPIPVDPKQNTSYIYSYTSSTCPPTCYTITACLENPNDPQKDVTKNSGCTAVSASYTITNPT